MARQRLAGGGSLAALLFLSLTATAQAQDSAVSDAAYGEEMTAQEGGGEYERALELVQPMAERGDAHAQYSLGRMYARGQGLAQDYPEAARWYRKAAEQGLTEAQYALGSLYANGEGLPRDPVKALRWMIQAAEAGDAQAKAARESLEQEMSRTQVQEAQRLAQ
ncbi:tetratricopeptide repeat protein [Halomonas sp. WWR20]